MKSRESELLFLYLFFDLTILNISILALYNFGASACLRVPHELSIYLLHANLSWLITYFVLSKKNLYLRDGFGNRFLRISLRTLIFLLVLGIVGFMILSKSLSRLFILEYVALFYVGKLVFYFFLYQYLLYLRRRGKHINSVLIVGVSEITKFLRMIIDSNPMLGYKFEGYLSRDMEKDIDVIGHPDHLAEIIKEKKIELVFVSLSLFSQSIRATEYLKICNNAGVKLRFLPENQRWFKSKINMESVGDLVVINPQQVPLDEIESRFFKRLFDLVFSLLAIVLVFSWLFPLLAIVIKLTSKGPVFFVQERTGINNRTFKCYKFRSMKVNSDADNLQASANDDRITSIGRFMRKTNIDELPQFFNVLFGQMSVVGPRPHMLQHTEQYSRLIEHYMVRHYVKPGVTGWAQVNGYRGETKELWKMEKRVEFDMDYIENWTFWWDLKIILMTIFSEKTYNNAF
jgi:putative colanic acid biosysnthesis UDP-glucose lipid carrier transferase